MIFSPESEKKRIFELLSPALDEERQQNKQNYLKKATAIALDEVQELKKEYELFISRIQHLQVFQQVIQQPLESNMQNILRDLRFMLEKNYTQEELERMPSDVYQQVVQSQKQRVDILKKIARTYLA
jgi:hypothetical protein